MDCQPWGSAVLLGFVILGSKCCVGLSGFMLRGSLSFLLPFTLPLPSDLHSSLFSVYFNSPQVISGCPEAIGNTAFLCSPVKASVRF